MSVSGGRSPQRRQRILAAVQLLHADGADPQAMSLDALAARAGTTKATIYRYFPSKAALIAEVTGEEDAGDGRERREQILDAAVRVVSRQGLRLATMERIAEEAGISPPALYWHFKSKDDLLLAIVDRLRAAIDPAALLGAAPSADPAVLLQVLADRMLVLQSENIELLRVFLTEVGSYPELAAALFDRFLAQMWGTLSTYMEREVAHGAFRPGHPLLRVLALAGMVTFYSIARRNFGDRAGLPPPAEAAREFVRIFLDGVRAEGAEA